MTNVKIVAVCTALPEVIGERSGVPVYSSISKTPVESREILLTYTNLYGDQQVDTRPKADGRQLHGGNEMVVYVYPSEHYAYWQAEYGQVLPPGSFGENLLVQGILEADVHLGDRWLWGAAELEVSKPREPCYKLAMHRGWPNVIAQMRANGRCGWYMRVIEPGLVPTYGSIRVLPNDNTGAQTIAERFALKMRTRTD